MSKKINQINKLKIYGNPSCDTMKKARNGLDATGIHHSVHDYKSLDIEPTLPRCRCREHGWEKLLNTASTTFPKLPPEHKANLDAGQGHCSSG